MSTQRIYIGGLTPDITEADVMSRFKPFGDVHACDIVRGKGITSDPLHCRGFAYVSFTPKDQAALARVFSLYNGCKWRGQKLRVELAKPDFLLKLQKEWQDEQQAPEAEQITEDVITAVDDADGAENNTNTIRITMPGKRKSIVVDLTSKAKSHRAWFPTHKEKRVADLSWEPLPQTKRVALQAAAEAAPFVRPVAAPAEGVTAATVAQQQQQLLCDQPAKGVAIPYQYKQQQQQQQQQQPAKGLKAQVDAEHWKQLKLLKRIAEQEHSLALQQEQHDRLMGNATAAPAATAATEDEPQQQQQRQVPRKKQQLVVPAGVVVMSDDDDDDVDLAPPGVGNVLAVDTAAALAQQLSKFDDDSDSSDEGQAPAAAQEVLVPVQAAKAQRQQQQLAQAAATAAATATPGRAKMALHKDERLHVTMHDQLGRGDLQLSPGREQHLHKQQQQAAGVAPHQPSVSIQDDDSSQDRHVWQKQQHEEQASSSDEAADLIADSSEQAEDEQQQTLLVEPLQQHLTSEKKHRNQQQQQQHDVQQQRKSGASGVGLRHAAPGPGVMAPDDVNASDSMEVDTDSEEQLLIPHHEQQQHDVRLAVPTAAIQQARNQQWQLKQQQHAAVVSFLDTTDADRMGTAAAALDRFGSDSEEVLVDVDDDDTAATAVGTAAKKLPVKSSRTSSKGKVYHTKQAAVGSKQRGRSNELLCPVAPRISAGRATVFGNARQQRSATVNQQRTA